MYRAILIALAAFFAIGGTVEAQVRSPRSTRYSASRPAISPWLSLSRGNTGGGVPSFQAWVQPQFELMKRQNVVDQQFGNVNQQFGNVQQEIGAVEGQLMRGPTSAASAPAVAPRFMDYGSFYPQPAGANVRPR